MLLPSDMKSFTRGGQITFHNMRMFMQIYVKIMLFALIVWAASAAAITWSIAKEYDRYAYIQYLWSKPVCFFDNTTSTEFKQPNGRITKIHNCDLEKTDAIRQVKIHFRRRAILGLVIGFMLSAIFIWQAVMFLQNRGRKESEDVFLKGDTIWPADKTRKKIKKLRKASKFSLAGLPLIKYSEKAHFLFHGTTGSGKSTAIKELLEQIRKTGDRAIIYDKSCNFLQELYSTNKDILLNPLDERSASWNLWDECRDAADFDSLAAAQIPMPLSTQDPFWVNAARTIFSAAAYEMRHDPDKSVKKLLYTLLSADNETLQNYLKGTEAEILVSEKIEKTAISIKSVLATYLKSLRYVKEDNQSFSIRKWIQDESAQNWLFVTSQGDRHETLKPLITAWLDIAVNALLSLMPSNERRIWLILDELASLQQLPYLTQTLSESRKFGGCVVVGLQNYAQLAKLYGVEGAREISALLNTRFMFRQPDPTMAKWTSENLGESLVNEVRESTSFGANSLQDGISLNRVSMRKPVVSFSEIISLADLYAYVRLPGDYPITLVNFDHVKRHRYNQGILWREDLNATSQDPLDLLIEQYDVMAQHRLKQRQQNTTMPPAVANITPGRVIEHDIEKNDTDFFTL